MPERRFIRWEPVLSREQPRGELDATWRWKISVGRDRDCDLVVKHGSIPGKQGNFLRLRNDWWFQDENSQNGTYRHGKRIHLEKVGEETLELGMMVRFRIDSVPMSAEELRLRAAIAEELDDDARFLVYADWLQEQGDEVGQLMVSPAPLAARWLGPLYTPGIEVTWRHGFFDRVTVRSAGEVFGKEGVFSEVFAHPLSAFVRTLQVDAVLLGAERSHGPSERWAEALFTTLAADRPSLLRHLKVRLPTEQRPGLEAKFEEARRALPQLRTTWDGLFTEGGFP